MNLQISSPFSRSQYDPHYDFRTLFTFASVLLLVGGCTTPTVLTLKGMHTWSARQTAVQRLTSWRIEGRIGVISGQEGWHAHFQWTQQDLAYRIYLIGPLGQGRVTIESDGKEVRIHTQDGQYWTAANADELLAQSLGVQLPVNGLRYWIRGLPEPGSPPALETDANGYLTRLEQNGWIIEYPNYIPTVFHLDLPERIVARRTDLSVKLVIEQWQCGTE